MPRIRSPLMISSIVLIVLLLVYWLTYSVNTVAHPENISLGVEFNTHAAPVWVALKAGLFRKYGLNITTLLKFRTGAELAAAMSRGEVDVGWACLGPILNLIDKGVKIKIVAKIHNYGYALVVNPSKILSIKDLNNVTVYSTGLQNPTNLLLIKIQDLYGVRFNVKPVGDPNTLLSMLVSGQIDAVSLPEHYASVAEARGAKILLRAQDIWFEMPGSYLVVREELLKSRSDVIKKLIEVTRDALRMIRSDENLVIQATSAELGIDNEITLKSINNIEWVDEITNINLREIQEYIDFMYSHGLLQNRLNATEIVAYGVS